MTLFDVVLHRTAHTRMQAERVPAGRRAQRRVVDGLRSVARRAGDSPQQRRFDVLLCDRAAPLRSELLEVAALLETAADPDPRLVAELQHLLTDGCGSPLYNREVHVSELHTTLYYARRSLS